MKNRLEFKTGKKYSVLTGLGLVLPLLEKHTHILEKNVILAWLFSKSKV